MENKFKRFLSLFVALVMVFTMLPANALAAEGETAVVTEKTADLTISTLVEWRAFAASVNSGNSYEGKTVVLAADIKFECPGNCTGECAGVVVGTKENPFKGTFDGQNHIISGLNLHEDGSESDYFPDTDDYLGLFGVINTPAVVKNVTVHDPYIVGSSYVGGIVGMAYTGTIENCHVTGEIDIEGHYMVGGITGHGYARIYNCSVIGEEGWDYNFIGGIYKGSDLEGDNVGGIVGHNAESNVISNCAVKNVTVSGTRKVGGIVGITAQSTKISGCSVSGVIVKTTATKDYANANTKTMSIGGIVGQYMAADKGTGGTLENCSVNGLTFTNENSVEVNAGALTGGVRATSGTTTEPTGVVVSGAEISRVTGATVNYMAPAPVNYVAQVGEQKFETLQAAIAAAQNGNTIVLMANVAEDVTVSEGKTVILDLAGFDIVGTINAITNNGTLTINDSVGTGNVYTTDVSAQGRATIVNNGTLIINGGWFGDSNNDTTDRNAINRGNALKNYGTATINGGHFTNVSNQFIGTDAYAYAINNLTGGTITINNATVYGDINGLIFADGKVVVNNGSFTLGRPDEENNLWYLAYGNVEIKGGTWTRAFKVPSWNTGYYIFTDAVKVSGGVFNVEIDEANLADGYAALPDLNGNYVVGSKPTATVNNLGQMTVAAGEYYIYNGSLTTGEVDMPLNFVMQFVANQTAADMETSPFANWYADFVITFEGIEGDSFDPAGCYLAGFYGETENWEGLWVKIPVDGLLTTIEEGVRYPVMLGVGMAQTYEYICSGVQAFSCAMYIPEEILKANPKIVVKLELNIVEDSDNARDALVSGENIYKVSETEYTAKDFGSKVEVEVEVEDKDGETVDVVITDNGKNSYNVEPEKTFDMPAGGVVMTFPAVEDADEGDMAFVVHKHEITEGKFTNYIYVGKVQDGAITITNTVGFSTFTVNAGGLADAIAAAQNGDTIVLMDNIQLTETVTIPAGKTITLDLNGKTISGTETETLTANDALIRIMKGGKLTIKDSSEAKIGTITYGYTGEATGWGGYSASTIENNQGTLIVESGKIVSTTNMANQIAYAINTLTNGNIGDAYVCIEGGEIVAAGSTAVRQFANSTSCTNTLVIKGGKITGRVQLQSSNANNNKGVLTITGGEIIREGNTAIEVWFSGGTNSAHSETMVSIGGEVKVTGNVVFDEAPEAYNSKVISGGTFSSDVSEFVADGFKLNENGEVVEAPKTYVAQIGEQKFETLAEAAAAAGEGDEIVLIADAYIAEGTDVTIPNGVTLNGNGFAIYASGADHNTTTSYGYVIVGGELTIKGETKIEKFSASYYNHTVNIGEGASLEVFGKNRVTVGYGNTFNITGTIADAKTADKATIKPSLSVAAGISFAGTSGVTFNVKNAYVSFGLASGKNLGGKFAFSFENSIVDFKNNLTFSSGSAVIDIDAKDSVLNMNSNLDLSIAGCDLTLDNSQVSVNSSMRNEGKITLTNGSTLTIRDEVALVEHGGNAGTITVDASTLTVGGTAANDPFDGRGTGSVNVINGGSASIGYISKTAVAVDTESSLDVQKIQDNSSVVIDAENYDGTSELNINIGSTDSSAVAVTVTGNNMLEVKNEDGKIVLAERDLPGSGTEADPYTISSVEELILFANKVNGGKSYKGEYVKLMADIDLAGQSWTPIGFFVNGNDYNNQPYAFRGNFDGNNKTISNLVVTGEDHLGLFGLADNCTIKNVKICNVNVTGISNLGALAGEVYSTSVVENCHISGTIQISGEYKIGGLYGHGYAKAMNNSVIGDGVATSYVKGVHGTNEEGDNIGGLIGHTGATATVTGNTVKNITVSGTRKVGGVVGITGLNSNLSGSVVENVVVETSATVEYANNNLKTMSIGGVVGQYLTGNTGTGDLSNCTVNNVTFNNVNDVIVSAGALVGGMRGTSEILPPAVEINTSGTTVANVEGVTNKYLIPAVAKIGETEYATLAEAIAAANGGEVEILCNVEENLASIENVTFTTNVAGGVTVINTCADWVNVTNVTIGSGVTMEIASAYFTGAGVNYIEGTLKAGTLYNANNSKTTVKNGGKIITTGMIVNRYHTDANAGIYVYGDGNNTTVEISCGDTIGTYSGTFYAKDAVVEGNMLWIDYLKGSTQEADKYAQSTPIFENSVVNITKELRLYKDATLTLNDTTVTAGTVQIRENATPTVTMDNSSIKANSILNLAGATLNAVLGEDGTVTFKTLVAKIGDNYYATLAEAIAAAQAGETVTLLTDLNLSEILVIDKAITLDGNGKILTSTAARAINVSGADGVTIKNLTINCSGERAINIIQNATNVTIENVTATAANYTVNVASSAPGAVVAIKNSTLTGLCTVNVASAGANVTIDNSTINCNDNNTTAGESYAALCLNKAAVGGSIIATNTTVNVTAGSDSEKGRNGAENGTVIINGSTEDVTITVAVITYANTDNYHGFQSLQEAIEFAKAGDTITLIRDIELTEGVTVPAGKNITLDLNGNDITMSVGDVTVGTQLICNKGTLTITDSAEVDGEICLTYTGAKNGSVSISTIRNEGVLNIAGGIINCVNGNQNISYAIDAFSFDGNGTVNISGGTVKGGASGYCIRMFLSGDANTLNVTGGKVGYVWAQQTNANANKAEINVTGGYVDYVYVASAAGACDVSNVTLNVKADCTAWEPYVGGDGTYALEEVDGVYKIVKKVYVAEVNGKKCESLQEAIDEAANGATVTLLADIELTEGVVIAAGQEVVLDLNGKTVSMVTAEAAQYALVLNKGNLTITDSGENGKLSYQYTGTDQSDAHNTIESTPNSVLTIKGGLIENLSENCLIAYAIDGLTNGNGGDVTVNIEGGKISSKKIAVRIFANSTTNTGTLNISGGEIFGRTIIQSSNTNANKAALNITGGIFTTNGYKSDVLYVGGTGNAAAVNASVSGGTFSGEILSSMSTGFISGGSFKAPVAEELCAEGFQPKDNGDGTYGVEEKKALINFAAANVTANNSLEMLFAVNKDAVADWTGHYIVLVREFADGTTDTVTYPFADWKDAGTMYYVAYDGLYAYHMCDQITLVIYDAEGEAISNPWVDSMKAYALRRFDQVNAATKSVFIEMLCYGAAAQKYFEYDVENLATDGLEQKHLDYVTEAKPFESKLDRGDKWAGSNLVVKSNIDFLVAFNGMTRDMYAVVEFTKYNGRAVSVTVNGSEFGDAGEFLYVTLPKDLAVADARQVITITVYNADGSIFTTCNESIEDYLARKSSVSDVFAAFMKYADAAYAYFEATK